MRFNTITMILDGAQVHAQTTSMPDVSDRPLTVATVAHENINGGMPAILTWGTPLALAVLIVLYILVRKPWRHGQIPDAHQPVTPV